MYSKPNPRPPVLRSQPGFSLVELLVGMVLAMIAVIVVMQVFQLNERSKRTTTGGDSAVMDGAIAITDLQRELRQAGMGESNLQLIGCSLALPIGATLPALAPVVINADTALIPAGDANTDTLLITYGNGNGSPEGDRVLTQIGANGYTVMTPTAMTVGDFVIPANQVRPNTCDLKMAKVSTVDAATPFAVTTNTNIAGLYDSIYNFGQQPVVMAYRVSGGRLQQCDFRLKDCRTTDDGVWLDLLDGVVSLRAEYGRDTTSTGDGEVDTYDQTQPTTRCGWARIVTVRLAVTLRSSQQEREAVTGSDAGSAPLPSWAGSASSPIDVSGGSHYRYKVFETVVPLRNIAWLGAQTVCVGKLN